MNEENIREDIKEEQSAIKKQQVRDYMREAKRKHDDKAASIDIALDEAISKIDRRRREKASESLVDFILTYFVGLMIDDKPSEKFIEALKEMEFALSQSRPYNIELPRGHGKTSAAEMAALYLLATGKRKFCVVISNNARAASSILKDIWRPIVEKGTAFSQDFPDVCLPFQLCDGAYRRRQTYRGLPTEIVKNNNVVQFARLVDGIELPASGSIITVRGITSGIRGLKAGRLRPDTVILDDLQSSETAANAEQVEKISDIIKRDIMNLSSKSKLAVLMTSTPICPDDLCDKIEHDISWKTTKHPAILAWPDDMLKNPDTGLWAQYFKIFDGELADDQPHLRSLEFYKRNREAMDAGAVLFSPDRFSIIDGHISGLQALLEKRHMIGDAAFQAEMQMKPKRFAFKLDISSRDVVRKASSTPRLAVPEGYIFVAASTDLNVSYAMTTVVVAFKPDMTAHVIHHMFTRCKIDSRLPQAEYANEVMSALEKLGKELKSLGIKIDGWGIDASGVPFDAVTSFAKTSLQTTGLPACAMVGRASHVFNGYVRSRLRDEVHKTVLCGDAQELVKSGAGKRYMFWDSDFYRMTVQKAFLAASGASGSCTLFSGSAEDHSEYALQVCNEKLLLLHHRADGRDVYTWKTQEPHDALDATAQAFAVAASYGISGASPSRAASRRFFTTRKPRVRIV